MKKVKEHIFMSAGDFVESEELTTILKELSGAINSVTWGAKDKFIINPVKKKNGVKPIKEKFVDYLVSLGWEAEARLSFADGMNPGPVDVIKKTQAGIFAVEWETGNISSSHRALNKIAVGLIQGAIIGGILILPIRSLATYLTDRIGNYEEIEPYFVMYNNLKIGHGLIGVMGVDYDEVSDKAPFIPKGKDGNAKKGS